MNSCRIKVGTATPAAVLADISAASALLPAVKTLLLHLGKLVFLHMPCLSLHPVGLRMNLIAGFSQQYGLPNHRQNLNEAYEYQAPCKPFEPPLYSYILAALLAAFIASWGGWLWGGGNRIWGGLLAVLGLLLTTSTMTAIGFGDPMFWRAGWRLLTGQDPDRRDCQDTEHSQLFQHDWKIVQQKLLTLSSFRYTVIVRGLAGMANVISTISLTNKS